MEFSTITELLKGGIDETYYLDVENINTNIDNLLIYPLTSEFLEIESKIIF